MSECGYIDCCPVPEKDRRIKELEAENQLAWNTCDTAETKVRKLEAQLAEILHAQCCECTICQSKYEDKP